MDRRHVGARRDVVRWQRPLSEARELLRVPLLDHAEAAKLPLFTVEVAMVVGVAGDEAVTTDVIERLNTLYYMYWKG